MTTNRKDDSDLTGEHARDTHQGGFGGDYARESHEPGSAARGDNFASSDEKDISDDDTAIGGKASG